MRHRTPSLLPLVAVAFMAGGLGGCSSINDKLTDGLADVVPQWAGGLPPDAPPRPGTIKYDEYMAERERKRLEPAPPKEPKPKSEAAQPPSRELDAVH